jgi:hypothetical protein
VADALPVLGREPQMHGELVQRADQAGDRGWVEVLVPSGERLRAADGLIDGGLPGRLG